MMRILGLAVAFSVAAAGTAWGQAAPAAPAPVAPGAPPADTGDDGHTLKLVGVTSMGVGGALGVATIALALYSHSARDQIETWSRQGNHEWTLADQSLWDKADRADKIAKITAIAGGATFVAGAVLYYFGVRAGERSPQIVVAPTPGGAAMGVTCAW